MPLYGIRFFLAQQYLFCSMHKIKSTSKILASVTSTGKNFYKRQGSIKNVKEKVNKTSDINPMENPPAYSSNSSAQSGYSYQKWRRHQFCIDTA